MWDSGMVMLLGVSERFGKVSQCRVPLTPWPRPRERESASLKLEAWVPLAGQSDEKLLKEGPLCRIRGGGGDPRTRSLHTGIPPSLKGSLVRKQEPREDAKRHLVRMKVAWHLSET